MSRVRILAPLFLLVLSIALVCGWLSQRQLATDMLREREVLCRQNHVVAQMRAENERLKREQIPDAEFARFTSDHSEIERLRHELNELGSKLDARERALKRIKK